MLYCTIVIFFVFLEHPNEYQESLKKHETLDKYLRDVYVRSHDPDVFLLSYLVLVYFKTNFL